MREDELLEYIRAGKGPLVGARDGVVVGPGDDCAVVEADGAILLLSVDQLVQERHVEAGTDPDLIGRKLVARSLSDIAAMGGRPICALATGLLKTGNESHARELIDAIHRWGLAFDCPVVGGDLATWGHTRGSQRDVFTMTIVGKPHPTRGPVLRSTANPGDGVYVTGMLGGSFPSGRHLSFQPRVDDAAWLCDELGANLTSMMDISDGLGIDASRIARSSGVAIELQAAAFPRQPDVADWRSCAGDGEDYELLFTAAADVPPATASGTPITRVGAVVVSGDFACTIKTPDGRTIDGSTMGWDHDA